MSDDEVIPADKVARKVAKLVTKQLPDVTAVLKEVVAIEAKTEKIELDKKQLEDSVKDAVKAAVRDVVHEVVKGDA